MAYNQINGYNSSAASVEENPSVGIIILAVLIPLVGYISYFTNKNEFPKKAKSYLYAALSGSALALLLMV